MAVNFELSSSIEESLKREFNDLDQTAKEAALVELYRQDKITHYELSQALGVDRFEAECVLKRHNVTEDLPTAEELEGDLKRLRELTGQ